MAWLRFPGALRCMGVDASRPVYVGATHGDLPRGDAGLICHRVSTPNYVWRIETMLANGRLKLPFPALVFKGSTLQPQCQPIHGAVAWTGGAWCCYRDPAGSDWIIADGTRLGCPRPPQSDGITQYWTIASNASATTPGTPATATKGGAAEEDAPLSWLHPRWELSGESPFGEYSPQGGATGARILGVPTWRSANGAVVVRRSTAWNPYGGATHYYPPLASAQGALRLHGAAPETWHETAQAPAIGGGFTLAGKSSSEDIEPPANIEMSWQGYTGDGFGFNCFIGEASALRVNMQSAY
jgi:hypothetical protein